MKLKAETEYKKADIQIKLKDLEIKEKANLIAETQLYMQGQLYEQNERIIKQNSTLLKNVANLKSVIAENANKIPDSQKVTNDKIIEGVESQKLVNEKLLQKLNQELIKDIEFEGKSYSKTEIEKLKDLETLKNVKDENETLLNDSLELVEDFLTDGFDIAYNPIEFIMNNIKETLNLEKETIKTKYNLKQSEV